MNKLSKSREKKLPVQLFIILLIYHPLFRFEGEFESEE
jgi:hypothetical protein